MAKKMDYLITGLAISIFFLGLCAVKEIFPFGSGTLATGDFEAQWLPGYYHIWDFLHGQGSLFFDWRVGGGNSFAGAASQFTLISPFNLFFLFIKRNWIEKSMTFFILMKLLVMGSTMCFFLRNMSGKRLTDNKVWQIVGGAAYALSGYSFLYYGLGWLDTAAVFPLLIYHFMKMAEKESDWKPGKHTIGYTLCYTLIFIMNIPQAYMVSFYMLVFSGGYFFLRKADRKVNCGGLLKFGIATLLALGLSAVIFLPAALGILNSYRLSGEEYKGIQGYFLLLRQSGMDAQNKWIILAGVIIPFIYLLIHIRRTRQVLWELYISAAMVIPVLVEGVNLLWHRGTYVCFPMRYGYMLVFTILMAAAEQMQEEMTRERKNRYAKWITAGILATWGVLTTALGILLIKPLSHEQEINFISDSEELGNAIGNISDIFHKVKIADASLDSNYPLISNCTSYSNYLHLMTSEQIALDKKLGYTQAWTRLSDTGGTLFSDALLGYRMTVDGKNVSSREMSVFEEELYDPFVETQHFKVFRDRYAYEPGLRADKSAFETMNQDCSENIFENQNRLSELFFGKQFIHTWCEQYVLREKEDEITYEIPVRKRSVLYVDLSQLFGVIIEVNGEVVPVTSFLEPFGTTYPGTCNNGVLSLGAYENETVSICIRQQGDVIGTEQKVYFGLLDLESFEASTKENVEEFNYEFTDNSCHIVTKSAGEEYLYLPLNADNGWHCSVNGREQVYARLYGNLMMIPLEEGTNDIVLKYIPRGSQKGAVISVIAFAIFIMWGLLSRIKCIYPVLQGIYHTISYIVCVVFAIMYLGFILWLYVMPIGYALYLKI